MLDSFADGASFNQPAFAIGIVKMQRRQHLMCGRGQAMQSSTAHWSVRARGGGNGCIHAFARMLQFCNGGSSRMLWSLVISGLRFFLSDGVHFSH